MNSLTKKVLAILIVLLLILVGVLGSINNKRQIVKVKDVDLEGVKDFHLSSRSCILYNGDYMYFFDKEGNVLDRLNLDNVNIKLFFSNDYAFVVDLDTNIITQYDDRGFLIESFESPGNIFNIRVQNKNIIFHVKNSGKEELYLRDYKKDLAKIYETPNYILTFDTKSRNEFVVGEVFADSTGYKSYIKQFKDGNKDEQQILNEVILDSKIIGRNVFVVSDKALYKVSGGEKKEVKIPNVEGVLMTDRNILLLHSGILSTYNTDLKEKSKSVVAANADRIEKISKGVYLIGQTDIGGEIGTRNEYYTRFPQEVEKVEINGLSIAALRKGRVTIYKVVNTRENPTKGSITDLDEGGKEN